MSLKLTGNGLFESSRMMLPEHKEAYNAYFERLSDKKRPELDVQETERISFVFAEALHEKCQVKVTLFHSKEEQYVIGNVVRIDPHIRKVKLQLEDDEQYWLPWSEIVDVALL